MGVIKKRKEKREKYSVKKKNDKKLKISRRNTLKL